MILWLRSKILEYRLFPVPLHMIPVVNHSMTNGIMDSVAWRLRVGQRFIADEEIEIFYTAFRRQMTGFGRNGWASSSLR